MVPALAPPTHFDCGFQCPRGAIRSSSLSRRSRFFGAVADAAFGVSLGVSFGFIAGLPWPDRPTLVAAAELAGEAEVGAVVRALPALLRRDPLLELADPEPHGRLGSGRRLPSPVRLRVRIHRRSPRRAGGLGRAPPREDGSPRRDRTAC